jgi:hypothetical protein
MVNHFGYCLGVQKRRVLALVSDKLAKDMALSTSDKKELQHFIS